MLLSELAGIKKYQDLGLEELITKFAEHSNYKKLGNGLFAYVFKHPKKNEVIKFWVKDDAYEKYLSYVEQHQSNPCLPKLLSKVKTISSFHDRVEAFPDKIKYVRLELLKPVSPEVERELDELWRSMPDSDAEWKEEAEQASKAVSDLIHTMLDIKKVIKLDPDLKGDNVMMRGRQMVLTDPFYDADSVDFIDSLQDLIASGGTPRVRGKQKGYNY